MARNMAVTSLLVALCLVVAVTGHGFGGGGFHRPIGFGGVHGGGLGGGIGGGLGLGGSGFHGGGSFNPAHFPGLLPGFGFYNTQPAFGFNKCKYWCKSSFTRQYYCCQQSYYG
nr:pupal cuticle protein Edg-91-like isoform X2 [Penaeus vannamei]